MLQPTEHLAATQLCLAKRTLPLAMRWIQNIGNASTWLPSLLIRKVNRTVIEREMHFVRTHDDR